MIFAAIYIMLWIAVSHYLVGVIHYSENKEYQLLNNKPAYFEVYFLTFWFILPSLVSTVILYGWRYQKPIKGVTYQ